MGWANEDDTERAGTHLLSLLAAEGKVPYARFYDGTDETQSKLLAGMGYPMPDDRDYIPDCPEIYMDLAVDQLESAGIVVTRKTGDKLADDEPAYEIELTVTGRAFIANNKRFKYRGVDL